MMMTKLCLLFLVLSTSAFAGPGKHGGQSIVLTEGEYTFGWECPISIKQKGRTVSVTWEAKTIPGPKGPRECQESQADFTLDAQHGYYVTADSERWLSIENSETVFIDGAQYSFNR